LFLFASRRRHTRFSRDWSSDVCSSDLTSASTSNEQHAAHAARPAAYTPASAGERIPARTEGESPGGSTAGLESGYIRAARGAGQIGRAACREGGQMWARGGG